MKVCVVGCGPAGLVASKHLKEAGFDFQTYDRSEQIGGTWIYSDDETDVYGQPIHTAMYYDLRTNFPKDLMEFEGLKYQMNESFIKSQDVLEYLHNYADKYGLNDYIKVGHMVTNIMFNSTFNKWYVTVEDLKYKTSSTKDYDGVVVCNGHHFTPRYPEIDGREYFKGLQVHSKDYRKADIFLNKTVLVIGFGYSGQDITLAVSKKAKKIWVSHHATNFNAKYYPDSVVSKPDIRRLHENSVEFEDGSVENIDAIVYCTGYKYSFPFLDKSCGISTDGDYVTPLYRDTINITNPTMAFIGLNFSTIVFYVFEAQVKAFVNILLGKAKLPSKEIMFEELRQNQNELDKKNVVKKKFHMIQDVKKQFQLINELGQLQDIKEVIYKIHFFNVIKRRDYLHNYRKYLYQVIDEDNFNVNFIDIS